MLPAQTTAGFVERAPSLSRDDDEDEESSSSLSKGGGDEDDVHAEVDMDMDVEELQSFLRENSNDRNSTPQSRLAKLKRLYLCIGVGIGLILACAAPQRAYVIQSLSAAVSGSHHNLFPPSPSPPHTPGDLIPIPTSNATFFFTERQYTQIQNYRRGTGLILHIHLTHHAGTTFCAVIGKGSGASPSFACRIDRKIHELNHNLTSDPRFHGNNPWYANETSDMIQLIRPYYHFITWEYWIHAPNPSLSATDWEDPNLVSVILMRDPLSRMLAGDGYVTRYFHNIYNPTNATLKEWWAFANMTHGDTNNFMLHDLSETTTANNTHYPPCCQGENTPRERLYEAQRLLERFTFVLDVACLDEGLQALAEILGMQTQNITAKTVRKPPHHEHPPIEERIPYKEVYDYLLQRNKLDLELYEWSQNRSLVRCADLVR